GADGMLYLLSRDGAPRKKILRLSTESPDLAAAAVVVPETEAVLQSFAPAASRLYAIEMDGGPTRLRVLDLEGRDLGVAPLGEVASVSGLTRLDGDRVLVRRESYVDPPAWFEHDAGWEAPRTTALVSTSPADFSDHEARRVFATADDGVKIPIDVLFRKGTPLDGSAPLLLYAYGSYGISQRPGFRATRVVWTEQGGISATACVRGGGEYGDEWHRAAAREKKKRSMEDLAACARFLVEEGYTTRDRLALEGGSAGGLLVYGTMALEPDAAAAVVSHVGIADAIRSEFSPNGEFNITEFGTVKDETEFRGMIEYSPYHQIRDGVAYPAVLSLTGINDPRVEPWQPFKMTARLQAAGSPNPVLLRISMKSGHGGGSLSQREERAVDVYSFLFDRLGIEYRPAAR
ncbi:MAG: prolyl oligopeptidase family serine peptidase, partial [Candidatus Eisenbacteria bacterium]